MVSDCRFHPREVLHQRLLGLPAKPLKRAVVVDADVCPLDCVVETEYLSFGPVLLRELLMGLRCSTLMSAVSRVFRNA